MPTVGFQDIWVVGARVFFRRDPILTIVQPIRDLGIVTAFTPNIETEEAECEDTDGGVRVVVAKQVTRAEESYDLELKNLGPDGLSDLFLSTPAEEFTQSSTPVVDADQLATNPVRKGFLLPIETALGVHVQDLASIDAVKDPTGVTTFVEGVDFDVTSLQRGFIRIIEGGSIVEGDLLKLSFTPNAISGLRKIIPLGQTLIQGDIEIYLGRENNTRQTVRKGRASLLPTGTAFAIDAFSTYTLQATFLSDLTLAEPAGDMVSFLGDLPATS